MSGMAKRSPNNPAEIVPLNSGTAPCRHLHLVAVVRYRGLLSTTRLSLKPGDSVSIGRGWDNDIILDDAYVDASHLRISRDADTDGLLIEDCDSANGTTVSGRRIRRQTPYKPGSRIDAGESTVIVQEPGTPVRPARKRDLTARFTGKLRRWPGLLLATLCVIAAALFNIYLVNAREASPEVILISLMGGGFMLLIWSLGASLLGKLFRNEMNFRAHWVLASIYILLASLVMATCRIVAFNLDSPQFYQWSTTVASSVILLFFLRGLFALSTRLHRSSRLALALVLTALPLSVNFLAPLVQDEQSRWSGVAVVSKANLPPRFHWTETVSSDEHIGSLDSLFHTLDEKVRTSDATTGEESTLRRWLQAIQPEPDRTPQSLPQ